jgi:hypothetical protein
MIPTNQLNEKQAGMKPFHLWHQFTVMDGKVGYQDDTLGMTAWTQPLPGVRLGEAGMFH